MVTHLTTVIGEIFLQHYSRLLSGARCHVIKMLLQMGETILDIVAMAGLQMLHHHTVVDLCQFLIIGLKIVKAVNIAYHEEEILVDTIVAAHLLHCLFAKSQRHAKTWQHKD